MDFSTKKKRLIIMDRKYNIFLLIHLIKPHYNNINFQYYL